MELHDTLMCDESIAWTPQPTNSGKEIRRKKMGNRFQVQTEKMEALAMHGDKWSVADAATDATITSTNWNTPVCSLPLGIMLLADACLAERMQTRERLRS